MYVCEYINQDIYCISDRLTLCPPRHSLANVQTHTDLFSPVSVHTAARPPPEHTTQQLLTVGFVVCSPLAHACPDHEDGRRQQRWPLARDTAA